MSESKINLLNRLVDYFLVVGLSEDKEPEIMFVEDGLPVYKPQLIDRYPQNDYEDIPFPPGVEIFCIPQGVQPARSIQLPKFHHFAATLGNGDRLHGTCLKFYEPVPKKLEPKIREHMEKTGQGWRTPMFDCSSPAERGEAEGKFPISPANKPKEGSEAEGSQSATAAVNPLKVEQQGDSGAQSDQQELDVDQIMLGLPQADGKSIPSTLSGPPSTQSDANLGQVAPPASPPISPHRGEGASTMDSKATASKHQLLNAMYPAPQRIPKSLSNLSSSSNQPANNTRHSEPNVDKCAVPPSHANANQGSSLDPNNDSQRTASKHHHKNQSSAGSSTYNSVSEINVYTTQNLPPPASPPNKLPPIADSIDEVAAADEALVKVGDESRGNTGGVDGGDVLDNRAVQGGTRQQSNNGGNSSRINVHRETEGKEKSNLEKSEEKNGRDDQTNAVATQQPKKSKMIYATKCICIVSHYGFFTQYLEFLRELYRISLSPSAIPMERYIVNFARETPLPPQGCLEIEYRIGQKALRFSRPIPNAPIDSPPFPYDELFRVLTPEIVVEVYTALLLEHRVVLISTPFTNLTLVSELLIQLMYPFAYEHVYIPILPKTLMDFLAAPMPFCIGVPREFLPEDMTVEDILRDKESMVVVDLDNNELHASHPITSLPPAERKKLHRRLKPLSRLYRPRQSMSPLELKAFRGRDAAFDYIPSPEELDSLVQSIPKIDDGEIASVQAAFLRVFVSIFKDYRRFLVPIRSPNAPPPSAVASAKPSNAGFGAQNKPDSHGPNSTDASADVSRRDTKIGECSYFDGLEDDAPSFLAKEFLRRQSRDARAFLSKFLQTQAFTRFTDQRVAPGPMPGEVENYDIKFFDESIVAKTNRSRFRFSKPTPFLDSNDFEIKEALPAPPPDTSGLPPGFTYQHTYFPRLNPKLYQATRRSMEENALMSKMNKLEPKVRRGIRKPAGKSMHSIPLLVKQISKSSLKLGKGKRKSSSKSFVSSN
eukprot:CAMPEP_0114513826 /NCGR_PEP_ID=MMETSP0109-20121206/15803_1 /TAXON_ID=29199 /ORGANISM="Chlorarachnion reptans, Strain CCCM449" /LENGTH=994 /DNA_ID=CAMNT_0001693777 /DNA_START=489 /DNA_END=3473 /DNA_ORIENTATION=+